MKRLLASFILVFCCCMAPAQPADTVFGYGYLISLPPDTLSTQPNNAEWHNLTSAKAFESYRNKLEFQESQKEAAELEAGTGFLFKILHFLSTPAGRALIFTFFITLFAFGIYKWVQQRSNLFWSAKKFTDTQAPATGPQDIRQDWQLAMEAAAGRTDFRAAIRFGYLWLLQKLDEKGGIVYHPNKTNRHYATELNHQPAAQEFRHISRLYERAWYGYQHATAQDFQDFKNELEDIISKA